MGKLGDWFDERTGYRKLAAAALDEEVLGGARFAYVFGSVLTFVLVLQMVTGVLLAMYYSPSSTDAWASVAYIQDEVAMGWFVRGLHSHGASAMVILSGLHLLQVAVFGAYKKPRELNWIIGVLMLGLILAFALTGYLLPWDQTGYWATQVATGIAGTSPVVGTQVQEVMQGGNGYGNLTITRFFALHVFVLPAALLGLTALHIALFRKHKQTPPWWLDDKQLAERSQQFWPFQMWKDMVAMALCFALLVGWNLSTHGASLDAPADPSSAFDARPEWYFRFLFQGLKYFQGPMEAVVALGAPLVLGGGLLAMPFLDRGRSRDPRKRIPHLAALGIGLSLIGGLTVISFREDANSKAFQVAHEEAEKMAHKARALAKEFGVPTAGGQFVYEMEPGYLGRKLFLEDCAGCHVGDSRKGPEILPGYNNRKYIAELLRDPSGDRFYGLADMKGMKPVTLEGQEFAGIVELIYAQTGATDADERLVALGQKVFDEDSCIDCHSIDWDSEDEVGPNLGRRGSVEMLDQFLIDPDHPRWFGDKNKMPSAKKYSPEERSAVVDYVRGLQQEEGE